MNSTNTLTKKDGPAETLRSGDLFGMAATAAAAIHHELGDELNAKRIHGALVGLLRGLWTQTPPAEQGTYWHWNGDEDCAPLPIFVLWSGFSGKCFVSCGQLGFKDAIDCDKYGGWWLPLYAPPLPNIQG